MAISCSTQLPIITIEAENAMISALCNINIASSIKDFILDKNIGSGRFGNVYLAIRKSDDKKVAIKIAPRKDIIKQEIKIHRKLQHENIVDFHDNFADDSFYYLVLEYVCGKTLFQLLNVFPDGFPEGTTRKYLKQITLAIEYCHRNGIVHRDLKLENVLIRDDDFVKVIDFGWAIEIKDMPNDVAFFGTPYYVSPESLISRKSVNEKVDIWCIGVVCYELLTGQTPFDCEVAANTYTKIIALDYQIPPTVSTNAGSFIRSTLGYLPSDRPNATTVLNHKFFNDEKAVI